MENIDGAVIVSYTGTDNEDTSLLLVGQKQQDKDIVIINAFQGEEATDLWKKLIIRKEDAK